MPLDDGYSLITLERAQLDATLAALDEDYLTVLLIAASEHIVNICGQNFGGGVQVLGGSSSSASMANVPQTVQQAVVHMAVFMRTQAILESGVKDSESLGDYSVSNSSVDRDRGPTPMLVMGLIARYIIRDAPIVVARTVN